MTNNVFPNRQRAEQLLASLPRPGVVDLLGPITQHSASEARRAIDYAERFADAICMTIDSPGGDVACANAIARDLKDCGLPVTARVSQRCDSASVLPLLAARNRIGRPYSTIFLHCSGLPAHTLDDVADAVGLRAWAVRLERIDAQHRALLSATGLPDWLLHQATSRNGLRLNARECVAYGLLDRVRP